MLRDGDDALPCEFAYLSGDVSCALSDRCDESLGIDRGYIRLVTGKGDGKGLVCWQDGSGKLLGASDLQCDCLGR